jgi:hypothetical protein
MKSFECSAGKTAIAARISSRRVKNFEKQVDDLTIAATRAGSSSKYFVTAPEILSRGR